MKIGRNMIVAIMITFCFTATLFIVIPIRSATSPYDPWIDYNDDGKISLSDLVSLANSYGTTGDPTKNVNVTNWPPDLVSEKEYMFFDYKLNSYPAVYLSQWHNIDYLTNSTVPITVEDYLIDGTKFNSTLSSEALFEFHCSLVVESPHLMTLTLVVNGISYSRNVTGLVSDFAYGLFQIDTNRTDNEILVQIASTQNGTTVGMRLPFYRVYYHYTKLQLASEDFGYSRLYLKSVTLDPKAAIRLDENPTQVITNIGTSTMTYEFSEMIAFSKIEFTSFNGDPEITVYALK